MWPITKRIKLENVLLLGLCAGLAFVHGRPDDDSISCCSLEEEELAVRKSRYKHVFTSALAQRLVMDRMKRVANFDPNHQVRVRTIAAAAPDSLLLVSFESQPRGRLRWVFPDGLTIGLRSDRCCKETRAERADIQGA